MLVFVLCCKEKMWKGIVGHLYWLGVYWFLLETHITKNRHMQHIFDLNSKWLVNQYPDTIMSNYFNYVLFVSVPKAKLQYQFKHKLI